jgi:hypothetical protein
MLGNEELSGESVVNGGHELSVNAGLHHIPEGARGQASAYEIGIGVNGQKKRSAKRNLIPSIDRQSLCHREPA